jgi:hypothetical protein
VGAFPNIRYQEMIGTTGRMKANLRRFEDLKIRLKKSSKMKPLREGISRTDLQIFISSKVSGEAIFTSPIFMKAEYSKIYVKIIYRYGSRIEDTEKAVG